MKLKARTCWRCGKGLGVIAIYNAYWHLGCWRKASEAEREAARKETTDAFKERK